MTNEQRAALVNAAQRMQADAIDALERAELAYMRAKTAKESADAVMDHVRALVSTKDNAA